MAPGEGAAGERACDGGESLEPFDDMGKVLQLAAGEAETLACVVVEAREAEPLMAAAHAEEAREATEYAAAEGFLAGEAAEKRVEQFGAEGAVDAAALLWRRRDQQLSGNHVHT